MSTPQIIIQNLSFSYVTDSGVKQIFSNLNFEIVKGGIFCITGPSGCGKSTLLRLLAGFEKSENGSIIIEGTPCTNPESNRIMIFQEFDQLLPWLTVTGNLLFPLRKVKKSTKKAGEIMVHTYLKMTGLEDAAHHYPYQLSGGMKQRAAIARALVLEPAILLMDEPFGSLDQGMRKELQKLTLQISQKTCTTVVFVTHDIPEAVYLSDKILVLGTGRVKQMINPLPHPRDLNSSEALNFISRVTHTNTL